jgi:hypothetical protein
MRNPYKALIGKSVGKRPREGIGLYMKIILKFALEKSRGRMWTGLIYPRIRAIGVLSGSIKGKQYLDGLSSC